MSQRPFFFHHRLGYRCNPFGALTEAEWPVVAFLPPGLQPLLTARPGHIQLLGRRGCGKTTTLLKLAAWARQQGWAPVLYEYLPQGQTHLQTDLARPALFVLDEAQRLGRKERGRWLDRATAVTCFFSSHVDLTPHFRRRGLPLQSLVLEELVSAAHYRAWVERRLAHFALPGGPRLRLSEGAITRLYQAFGADMREAEYFLYELFQREWENGQIEASDLPLPAHF